MKTCPRCSAQTPELIRVEAGMKLRLNETGVDASPPPEVCTNCYKEYSSSVSQGAQLIAAENAKAHNRMVLWKNRISLIKQGQEKMSVRAYSEAALLYEKYIRTLEICNDIEAGKLDPLFFNKPGQEKELYVLATVYWDLMRVYDSSSRYGQRLATTSRNLLKILPYCKNKQEIIRKANRYLKSSKNYNVFKNFCRESSRLKKGGGCYIATASFGSQSTWQVQTFYHFRDKILYKSFNGRLFICIYYLVSPTLANYIANRPSLKKLSKKFLTTFAMHLKKRYNL